MNKLERTHCSQKIDKSLNQLISQVSGYIDYLSDIKSAIAKNDTVKLIELIEKQQVNPELITATQNQQADTLQQYGFEVSKSGLQACIQACENPSQLTNLNNSLNEKLGELEKALLVNSLLIEKGQKRIKNSIRILSGHSTQGPASSYSSQGNLENTEISKHTLAQA